MRRLLQREERGQAMVEFGFIAVVLFMFSIGLVDAGRAFYQYNAVANAARYGARYGGVVGGTCSDVYNPPTEGDWCNQGALSGVAPPASCSTPPTGSGAPPTFWTSNGNWPCQSVGTSCPTTLSSSFTGYYTVGDFASATYPSIVAMIARRFDTNQSSSTVLGSASPGFDLSKLKVCIQPSIDPGTGSWSYKPGGKVAVFVYYPFSAVGPLLGATSFNLVASSQYTLEG